MKPALPAILILALSAPAVAQLNAAPADEALVIQPFAAGFPRAGDAGIPTDTLIWTHQPVRLVGPDGELPLVELTRFSSPGTEVTIAQDPGPLAPDTEYTVLDETGEFTLATFTTGDAPAPSPETPVITDTEENPRRFFPFAAPPSLTARVEWSGMLLLVEPDGAPLDELTFAEQLVDGDFLNFSLDDGPVDKRVFTLNAAGEMSEPARVQHEPGGCAQVKSELLALWPILGLLAVRARRRKER